MLSAVIASNVERRGREVERGRERERERAEEENHTLVFGLSAITGWLMPLTIAQIKKSKCGICCNKARAMGEGAERMA